MVIAMKLPKWMDAKLFEPETDKPFIAFIEGEVIAVVMDKKRIIHDLFSYYNRRRFVYNKQGDGDDNYKLYTYDCLIYWRKLPRRP